MSPTRRCLTILLVLCCFYSLAQPQLRDRLDSLRKVAARHANDTLGVLAFADLCYEYRVVDQDSALRFGEMGIALGRKLGFISGLAQVYSDAAFLHYDKASYDKATSYWREALSLRRSLGDSVRVASLQLKLGGSFFRKGEYEQALRHQLAALRLYEGINIPMGIGQALNNVAAVYEYQNDLNKALEYYQQAFVQHQKTGNTAEMGTSLINTGNIYFRKGNYPEAKKVYHHALALLVEKGNSTSLAVVQNNLAEIYTLENNYDSAQWYSAQALALRRKIGEFSGVVSSLNMMGRIETQRGNYALAERYLLEALDSAQKKGVRPEEGKIHLNLYELYKANGDWRRSLDAHVQYAAVKDSLISEAGRKEVAALQVRYETDKKEQTIALQDAELARKETRIQRDVVVIAALVVTLALIVIIVLLLRGREARKRDVARKEHEISLREALIKASIESQENERKRFARDLHDGMGQWISSLRLSLEEINTARDDEKKLDVLERTDGLLKQINHEFRSIAFNLMPHTLIHAGLKPALDEMVSRLNQSGGPRFSVSAFNFPGRLTEQEEISLYRVIQEWTNNIIKYASANRVEIHLTGHEDELVVMVEDDGRGFDVNALEKGTGNGWKNIRSRMSVVKGTVEVDSHSSRSGTTLTLRIPKNNQSQPVTESSNASVAG